MTTPLRRLGSYELIGPIGLSSTAEVTEARPADGGPHVAIKRLLPHAAEDPELRARFDQEILIATSHDHPGLVKGLTVFTGPAGSTDRCLVMTLVKGRPMAGLLTDDSGTPRPSEAALAHVAYSLASILRGLHDHARVHGDLSARNVVAHDHGDFTLLDLGSIADVGTPARELGTPRYVCPEREADHPMTPQGDLYSLGVILWELGTGRRWPLEDPPSALPEGSPLHGTLIATLIARCIARDPADRPLNAEVLQQALTSGAFHPEDARERWCRWAR